MFGPAAGPGYPQPGGEGLLFPAVQHGQDLWDSGRTAVSSSVCVQIPEAWTGATPEQGRPGEVQTRRSVSREDSALRLMPMVLFEVAREARSEKGWMAPAFVQENPRDPKEWLGTGENGKGTKQPELGWATFWAWPETEEFAARNQMLVAKLDQGPLGHERRKPTTLLTNQVEVMALHGVRDLEIRPAEVGRWRIA